ncbi:hypothetical protein JL722_1988 [Aureococcus anophagefferens]|nr:hypothetical protein JL722_1988 [Aureococcus anophagefferens]
MGAGALIRQAQEFDGGANASWIATYGEWCVEAMTLAHERWEALGKPAEVSRGDWFEIFNEYTIIVAGGHFVSLPMDEFSRLQRYVQDRKAKAPTDVAFVLMALLGAGDPQHKADVIFSMYEQGGVVTPERMAPLMAALVKSIHALGLTKRPETREQVGEQLASAPMSPRLDVADIVKGCYDRDGTPLDKDAFWSETGSYEVSDAQRQEDFDAYMARVNLETGMSYKDLSTLRTEFAYALANKHEPHHLDAKTGKFVHPEMGYTMSIGRLKSVFDADGNGVVDFVEFATGLARIVSVKASHSGPDPDENENILEFIFSLFDKNGDGVVELWEICELVETAHDDLIDLHRYACEKTKSLDVDGDGEVSDAEFIQSIQRDKVYRDLLWSSLPPVPASIKTERLVPLSKTMREAARARARAESRADADVVIVQMFMDLRADLLMYTQTGDLFQMEFDKFWYAVEKIFGEAISKHRDDAAEVFALPGGGRADASTRALGAAEGNIRMPGRARDINRCRARACAGVDTKFKAHLISALVNDSTSTESRGVVTMNEIQRFLDEMKAGAESLSTHAVKILDELDDSGDGKLDMGELKSVIFENPSVLRCMSALQMYNNDRTTTRRRGGRRARQAPRGRQRRRRAPKSQRSARRPSQYDIQIPDEIKAAVDPAMLAEAPADP